MNILWFRRDLRLHDNPSLLSAIESSKQFLALYIFDTSFQDDEYKPYHMHGFLLECLSDLNESFNKLGTKLHIFMGCPLQVIGHLHTLNVIEKLCFIQDCEPIWHARDNAVKNLCLELDIKVYEHLAHTLWDPMDILTSNDGTPPLTYNMFLQIAMLVGDPPQPVEDPSWEGVDFLILEPFENENFELFQEVPSLKDIGVPKNSLLHQKRKIIGGETNALKDLEIRLQIEEAAFQKGFYRPNQIRPDILEPPLSLSAAISLGAISVRLCYWKIQQIFNKVHNSLPPSVGIIGQLIWREYFYTMSRMNPKFNKCTDNPVCLAIQWKRDDEIFNRWKNGVTGYPFIDAGMRQLNQEGWIHHTVRSAVAIFLTRGDLWQPWDLGADYMARQLIDSDWSVNSGNWLWVSNSIYENSLNKQDCIDPVICGKRLDPSGEYIRRYVPELAELKSPSIHEPWNVPIGVQEICKCVIGKDYPERIVIHEEVWPRNQKWMEDFRSKFEETPIHCQPSSEKEILKFFQLNDDNIHNF